MKIYRISSTGTSGELVTVTKEWESGTISEYWKVIIDTDLQEQSVRKWSLMSEDNVRLVFTLDSNVILKIGDFLYYENERYILTDRYEPVWNEESGGYDYDLTFDAQYMAAKNRFFRYCPESGGQECSWALTSTPGVQLGVFLTNLQVNDIRYRYSTTENGQTVYREKNFGYTVQSWVNPENENVSTTAKAMSYSSTGLIDALTSMASTWSAEWWVEQHTIYFGKCGSGDTSSAQVIDLNTNAVSIKASESSTRYASRIWPFGSTRNLPARYDKILVFTPTTVGTNYLWDENRLLDTSMFESSQKTEGQETNVQMTAPGASDTITTTTTGEFGVTPDMTKTQTLQTNLTKDDLYKLWMKHSTTESILPKTFSMSPVPASGETWRLHVKVSIETGSQYGGVAGDKVIASGVEIGSVSGYMTVNEAGIATWSETFQKEKSFVAEGTIKEVILKLYVRAEKLSGSSYEAQYRTVVLQWDTPKVYIQPQASQIETTLVYTDSLTVYSVTINAAGASETGKEFSKITFSDSSYVRNQSFTLPGIKEEKVKPGYFTRTASDVAAGTTTERRLHMASGSSSGTGYIKNGYYIQDSSIADCEAVEETVIFEDCYPRVELKVSSVEHWTTAKWNEEEQVMETYHYYAIGLAQRAGGSFTFDSSYRLENTDLTVLFEAGAAGSMLSGMEFVVNFYPNGRLGDETGHQMFELIANETYGRLLPDATLLPQTGDYCVLTGWDTDYMESMGCLASAEAELLNKAVEYLKKSKIDPSTYTCTMDSAWADTNGYLAKGRKVNIYPDAYDSTRYRESRVIGFEIKMDLPYDSPIYTIGESASYSLLGEIGQTEAKTFTGNALATGSGSGTSGDADTLDGAHLSELLSALSSNSTDAISITVGGVTKTISASNLRASVGLVAAGSDIIPIYIGEDGMARPVTSVNRQVILDDEKNVIVRKTTTEEGETTITDYKLIEAETDTEAIVNIGDKSYSNNIFDYIVHSAKNHRFYVEKDSAYARMLDITSEGLVTGIDWSETTGEGEETVTTDYQSIQSLMLPTVTKTGSVAGGDIAFTSSLQIGTDGLHSWGSTASGKYSRMWDTVTIHAKDTIEFYSREQDQEMSEGVWSYKNKKEATIDTYGIASEGGVSAKGIIDLTISGGGGSAETVAYDDLDDLTEEEDGLAPTAWAAKIFKDGIGLEQIDEFNPEHAGYERGDVVRIGLVAYRFTETRASAGTWDPSYAEEIHLDELAKPLKVRTADINGIIQFT